MYTSIQSLSPYRILKADEHSAGKKRCVCVGGRVGNEDLKTSTNIRWVRQDLKWSKE